MQGFYFLPSSFFYQAPIRINKNIPNHLKEQKRNFKKYLNFSCPKTILQL